ncbi:MAG: hypothetical protein AAF518_04475 [Spirochaetota bacterium]
MSLRLRNFFQTSFTILFRSKKLAEESLKYSSKEFLYFSLRMFLVFAVLFTLVLLLSNLNYQRELKLLNFVQKTYFAEKLFPKYSYYFAEYKLYFLLGWLVYALLAAIIRYFFLKILGESNLQFSLVLAFSLCATLPLMLASCIGNVTNDLFPFLPNRDSMSIFIQLLFLFGIVLLAFLWEARIYIHCNKRAFATNFGRAFLTWSLPMIVFFNFMGLVFTNGTSL